METVISFTPGQLLAIILTFFGAVVTISGGVGVFINLRTKMKAPETRQDERLARLEQRVAEHDEYFKKDKIRIEMLEEGNKVTHKALLALLEHSIDGNNIESLKVAKEALKNYLIER